MDSPISPPPLHCVHAGRTTPTPLRATAQDRGADPGAAFSPVVSLDARRDADTMRDILIVDDDSDLRELLRITLQDQGYEVDVARDGGDGLAHLQRRRYRLLLLDLLMPRVDGLVVLRTLRDQPALRPPAVIVVSGLHQQDDVLPALEAGADDYLVKPFDLDDLIMRVGLWLRRVGYAPPVSQGGLRIHSLGRFRVESQGRLLLYSGGSARKTSLLFRYLLTHQDRTIPTKELFNYLWPRATPDVAAVNLRSLLHQLRKVLESPARDSSYLEHTGATLALRLGPHDWWDVSEFTARLDEGARWHRAGEPDRALDAYAAGVALYMGEYLAEDPRVAWAGPLRGRLREDWLQALEAMSLIYGQCGAYEQQETVLRTVIRMDPYREHSHRALMTLLASQGRGTEALVHYRQLTKTFSVGLESAPDPETQALAARIRESSLWASSF